MASNFRISLMTYYANGYYYLNLMKNINVLTTILIIKETLQDLKEEIQL